MLQSICLWFCEALKGSVYSLSLNVKSFRRRKDGRGGLVAIWVKHKLESEGPSACVMPEAVPYRSTGLWRLRYHDTPFMEPGKASQAREI